MQNPSKSILTISVLVLLMVISSCTTTSQNTGAKNTNSKDPNEKISVIATFYPLYDITKKITGDKADVLSIVPSGVEPHDYEPTPTDIIKLNKADIFVTIGLEFSNIENQLTEGNENIKVIDSKKGIEFISAEHDEEEDEHEDEGEHEETDGKDPHIWLSPKNMAKMATNIRDGLKSVDSTNSESYDTNSNKLIENLNKLDSDYKTALSKCKKNVILTNHRAFAYLAKDYGFKQTGISGIEPETEPTAKEIINLKNEALKNGVKYIFTEELVDTRIAETIAKEVGAKTLVLDPIEGTKNPDEDYISLMQKNLVNLKLALECS